MLGIKLVSILSDSVYVVVGHIS